MTGDPASGHLHAEIAGVVTAFAVARKGAAVAIADGGAIAYRATVGTRHGKRGRTAWARFRLSGLT